MGVWNHAPNEEIEVGTTVTVSVARVKNTSNCSEIINVTATWYGNSSNARVYPSQAILKPEESYLIYIEVDENETGYYEGVVEICAYVINQTLKGNPNVGGSSVKVQLHVIEPIREIAEDASTPVDATVLVQLAFGVMGISALSLGGYVLVTKKKRRNP